METEPSRRRFLRGAAGAVGMGAVGVFAAKARFAGASEKVASSNQPIPISTVGDTPNCVVLVPPVAQRGRGAVLWKNNSGQQCTITFIVGPDPSNLPPPVIIPPGPPGIGIANLENGWYKYSVAVQGCGTVDPWLDIQ
jgi:hypothetical protein